MLSRQIVNGKHIFQLQQLTSCMLLPRIIRSYPITTQINQPLSTSLICFIPMLWQIHLSKLLQATSIFINCWTAIASIQWWLWWGGIVCSFIKQSALQLDSLEKHNQAWQERVSTKDSTIYYKFMSNLSHISFFIHSKNRLVKIEFKCEHNSHRSRYVYDKIFMEGKMQ